MILWKKKNSSIFKSHNEEDTKRLASFLAELVSGGEVIFLRGPIGAGKTTFVKGVAEAMGMPASPVSASFSLLKEYRNGNMTMYHIDLFRLKEADMANLGFEDMLENEKAVIFAEWPDPIAGMLSEDRLEIEFELLKGDDRRIKAEAHGAVSERLLNSLKESFGH